MSESKKKEITSDIDRFVKQKEAENSILKKIIEHLNKNGKKNKTTNK